jgi:small subunit ribosomal protein S5
VPRRGRNQKRNSGQIGDFDRKVVSVRRVAKVRSGSKRLRFSSLVVAGNRKGKVGIGLGRGADTRKSIDKAYKRAVANAVEIELIGDTIPHQVETKYRAAKVLIKPAGAGTGVIASAPVRAVLELAGVRNVLTKQLGSPNEVTNAYATFEAVQQLKKNRIMKRKNKNTSKKSK